ncbi:peptidase [Natrialba hulunbeirensis JCM 10989]|uniref:Peptidase n=1 Tax=Natrialba hulunbeirensis JCM 10989 TaxID=1227493 RepID=M0A648_9EURY|nr:hypothetical protein [Natrialba hulunbeirensis]ELY94230.1 peptidase [Natrialba hulunbeirensis JCM 10989]
MSLEITVGGWLSLAVTVALATIVAGGIGVLYGHVASRLSGETATRRLNVIATGLAAAIAFVLWFNFDFGHATVPRLISDGFAVLLVGLAGGAVGTASVAGTLRATPDLFHPADPTCVCRRYARALTTIIVLAFGFPTVVRPVLQGGPLAILALVPVIGLLCWLTAPILISLLSPVRQPTDAERNRLADILESAALTPRSVRVRVVDSEMQFLTSRLAGPPQYRVLFVSRAALESLDDAALTALVVARREQKRCYSTLVVMLPLLGAAVGFLLAFFLGAAAVGTVLALGIVLLGWSGTRRLRFDADRRAADEVGAAVLADAIEHAVETGGFAHDTDPGREWFSPNPLFGARIERLRARSEPTNNGGASSDPGPSDDRARKPSRGR